MAPKAEHVVLVLSPAEASLVAATLTGASMSSSTEERARRVLNKVIGRLHAQKPVLLGDLDALSSSVTAPRWEEAPHKGKAALDQATGRAERTRAREASKTNNKEDS